MDSRFLPNSLPQSGFLIITQVLREGGGPIPLGRSRWLAGVASGEFPPPLRFAGRNVWKVEDILDLIGRIGREAPPARGHPELAARTAIARAARRRRRDAPSDASAAG
jgi:hypothetical protein